MIVGDLMMEFALRALDVPEETIDDRAELERSAARLLDYEFDALLLCDGEPLPSSGQNTRGSS